jgi:isoleucyl-tRNA synthetase
MPEGFTEEQLDAAGDGEVLVLVDLRIDDDMIESRTTREIINRVQKLRKSAGIKIQDTIEVFVDITSGETENFMKILERNSSIIAEAVGVGIQVLPESHMPSPGNQMFKESHELELGSNQTIELDVIIHVFSQVTV